MLEELDQVQAFIFLNGEPNSSELGTGLHQGGEGVEHGPHVFLDICPFLAELLVVAGICSRNVHTVVVLSEEIEEIVKVVNELLLGVDLHDDIMHMGEEVIIQLTSHDLEEGIFALSIDVLSLEVVCVELFGHFS